MAGLRGGGAVPSLPPPRPKSPPPYPDLYGKRRELAKVQMLEREISFLEEELKSIEGLQLASRSCKEVVDFVTVNAEPLIPTRTKKTHRSCRFWKWLCRVSCFNFSWICCCSCSPHLELPRCLPHLELPPCCHCDCNIGCSNCCGNPCTNCCKMPKCHCSSCCISCCFPNPCKCSCRRRSCCSGLKWPSCLTCSCQRCCFTCYPECPKPNICSCCRQVCCFPCYICY